MLISLTDLRFLVTDIISKLLRKKAGGALKSSSNDKNENIYFSLASNFLVDAAKV